MPLMPDSSLKSSLNLLFRRKKRPAQHYTYIPRIAFVCSGFMHLDHYRYIWRHLKPDEFTILYLGDCQLIEKYCTQHNLHITYQHELESKQIVFDIAITFAEYPQLSPKTRKLAKYYVRYMLQGWEAVNLEPSWNKVFDMFQARG
mgnify:CR=1 FL=1